MRADIQLPYDTDLEKFKPISGYVVVKPHEVEQPRIIQLLEWRKHESCRGTILLMADDIDEESLRPGQDVLFSPYSHRIMELNGNYLFLVHWSDVTAILVTQTGRFPARGGAAR